MELPAAEVQDSVTAVLRSRPIGWRRVERGYTNAGRWLATLEDGSTCFVKAATDIQTAGWLRAEHVRIYSQVAAPFLPQVLGWHDEGSMPILILEDLSHDFWPPPWSRRRVEAILEMLAAVRATRVNVPGVEQNISADLDRGGWESLVSDPTPFLALALCSHHWLEKALPVLLAATSALRLAGVDLLHCDVRSDNICFRDERPILIDWNHACRGNGEIDLAFWAPSLAAEGGPAPEEIAPDSSAWSAVVSGYFAARAGRPPIVHAPRVREVQLQQLRVALPWAVRALGLPPLDGANAPAA